MKAPRYEPIRLSKPPNPPTGSSDVSRADEIEALRAAIREAHEVLRDLRTERRALEQMVAGIQGRVRRAVEEVLKAEVEQQVAQLGDATERAMAKSVAKVQSEFDRLERIFTGQEKPGQEPLEDLIRHYVATKETPTP